MIKNHTITQLSEGVQRFYNAECCAVSIDNCDNIDEIFSIINENKYRRS